MSASDCETAMSVAVSGKSKTVIRATKAVSGAAAKSGAKAGKAAAKSKIKAPPKASSKAQSKPVQPKTAVKSAPKVAQKTAAKTAAKSIVKAAPPAAKAAAPKPAVKAAAAQTPVAKTPAAKTPPAKTPVAKVQAAKGPATKVQATKTVAPASQAQAAGKAPSAPSKPAKLVASVPVAAVAAARPAVAAEPPVVETARPAPAKFAPSGMGPRSSSRRNDRAEPPIAPSKMSAKMAKAQEKLFSPNDYVVYPTHGVGQIIGVEDQTVAGMSLRVFAISFESEKMILRVPVEKAKQAGLRAISTRKEMQSALATLKGRARIKRVIWSRRAQEYEAKINSGSPTSIAEVVRDLHRAAGQPDQSYSERQIYEAALDRLARELALVEDIDQPSAAKRVEKMLRVA